MDKDEILEKSRRENNNQDLARMSVVTYADSIAGRAGAFLCGLVSLLSVLLRDILLCSPWVIYFGILGTSYLVRFNKTKCKSDLYLTCVFSLMFLTVLVFLIIRLQGAAL